MVDPNALPAITNYLSVVGGAGLAPVIRASARGGIDGYFENVGGKMISKNWAMLKGPRSIC